MAADSAAVDDSAAASAERERLADELQLAASARLARGDIAKPDGTPYDPTLLREISKRMSEPPADRWALTESDRSALRIQMLEIQRERLGELSHEGSYSTEALREALGRLDAEQISLQLRLDD